MATAAAPAFAIDIVQRYVDNVHPNAAMLMVGVSFPGILVPLLLMSVYLSAPRSRGARLRTAVVFLLLSAMALGAWNVFVQAHTILSPFKPVPAAAVLGLTTFSQLIPWLADCVAALQLEEFLPHTGSHLKRTTLARSWAGLIATLTARVVLVSLSSHRWRSSICIPTCSPLLAPQQVSVPLHFLQAEGVIQAVVRLYIMSRLLVLHSQSSRPSRGVLRSIFTNFLGDYMITAAYSIGQVVVAFTTTRFDVVFNVLMVNAFVSVMAVTFSTMFRHGMVQQPSQPSKLALGSTHLTFRNMAMQSAASDEVVDVGRAAATAPARSASFSLNEHKGEQVLLQDD